MVAAGVSPGSMTTTRAPFALARFSACHCGGSAAYGLRPTTSAQRVLSMSSPLLMASPVIRSLNARHPPHRSWFIIQLGDPKARRSNASMTPRLKCALLTAPHSAAGPYRSRTASIASAIASSASSHDTRCHRPPPRGPVRLKGYSTRSGW